MARESQYVVCRASRNSSIESANDFQTSAGISKIWLKLVLNKMSERRQPITAIRFAGRIWHTATRPATFLCNDGKVYVVKGPQNGRMLANEQIVGALSRFLNAPVPETATVRLTEEVLSLNREHVGHNLSGVGHGSEYLGETSTWTTLEKSAAEELRFALLAVLFSWTDGNNFQWLYRDNSVFSCDHGHSFPSGPNWSVDSLQAAMPPILDRQLFSSSSSRVFKIAMNRLRSVTFKQIAEAVAAPLDEWGISLHERICLAVYLEHRRRLLITVS